MSDEIVLTLPRDRRYHDVAHLVVGGLAVRLDLTVESLSDLQLAMTGLLPRDDPRRDVTVALRLEDGMLHGRIGPFETESLRRDLAREGGDGYGTHHVLEAVFDSYRLDADGGDAWVDFAMSLVAGREA